jgi:hypothetical protein
MKNGQKREKIDFSGHPRGGSWKKKNFFAPN